MAFDAFLYFPSSDVKGETLDEDMKKNFAFEINSFGFGAENNINITSATGGGGAGRATFNEFTVQKTTDTGSCPLFLNLAMGKHFDEAKLELRRSGGSVASGGNATGTTFLTFTFFMVLVQNISWSGSSGDDVPTEDVTFQYGAIRIEYKKQNKKGAMEDAGKAEWSRVLNKQGVGVGA